MTPENRSAGDPSLRTEPLQPDKSLGQLMADMTSDLSVILRKEIDLAKVELKEEGRRAGKAGGKLGVGAVTAYTTILFASFAVAWLLNEVMHVAAAFFIVALLHGIATSFLISRGRQEMKHVDPVPRQTVETLKEDAKWARAQKS